MHIKDISKKEMQMVREQIPEWTEKQIAEFIFLKGRLPCYKDDPCN